MDDSRAVTYLLITIVFGSLANTFVKQTEGFTLPGPIFLTVFFSLIAFACMSQVMLHFPVGLTYTIYASSVIVLVNILAYVMYRQFPTSSSILGTLVILCGIALMNIKDTVFFPTNETYTLK